MSRWWVAGVCLLALSCGTAGSAEDAGDMAYAEGRWDDAARAWRTAEPGPVVTAKLADVAMITGNLTQAAVLWTRLAGQDSTRRGEAAAGLARAAQAADRANDRLALATSVLGLRQVAAGWPVGRHAMKLHLDELAAMDDRLLLTPAILAGGPSRSEADSLLLRWAGAVRDREGCLAAVSRFAAIEFRTEGDLAAAASGYLAECGLEAGLARLESGDYDSALRTLGDVTRRDPGSATGRRALIAVGDVHSRMGDPFSAVVAWQTVASWNGPTDSITTLALERLRAMPSGDSLEVPGIR